MGFREFVISESKYTVAEGARDAIIIRLRFRPWDKVYHAKGEREREYILSRSR